jgi:DNA-binding response OmpR family regulator
MGKIDILYIEDDKFLSKVVKEELKNNDFDVRVEFDGESGLKAAQSKKPDLVLLDLLLPEKGGFEVLKTLKESPTTKDIPVIILTSRGGDEDLKKGLSLGASDYIVKGQHAVGEIITKVEDFFNKGLDSKNKTQEENTTDSTEE